MLFQLNWTMVYTSTDVDCCSLRKFALIVIQPFTLENISSIPKENEKFFQPG